MNREQIIEQLLSLSNELFEWRREIAHDGNIGLAKRMNMTAIHMAFLAKSDLPYREEVSNDHQL